MAFHVARANALAQAKGFAAPETVAALTVAKQLLDAGVGSDLQRFFVLYGLCPANFVAGRMEPALALARQIVEVANRQEDLIYRLVGYRLLGTTLLIAGQNRDALESLQQAEQYRDPRREKLLSYRFGYDPGLALLGWKASGLTFLGRLSQAAQINEKVRVEIASHGHAPTVAACNLMTVVLPEIRLGDFDACERHSAELVAYSAETKVEYWRLTGAVFHACARAMRQPTEENLAAIRNAIEAYHRSGSRFFDSQFYSNIAEASLMAGDVKGADAALREAFAFVEQSGERYWLADLHRVDGQIALKRSEPDRARAEACFLKAIEIARSQEARLLELRAATDLARLWRDTGSNDDPARAAGADPRRDRGRGEREGCPQRPRAAGRDRLIEIECPNRWCGCRRFASRAELRLVGMVGIPQTATSTVVNRNGRCTSTSAVRIAQIAAMSRRHDEPGQFDHQRPFDRWPA